MKAYIIERAGGPEVLTLADVPAPDAKADEVAEGLGYRHRAQPIVDHARQTAERAEEEQEDGEELTRELEAQMADLPYEALLRADRRASRGEKKEGVRGRLRGQARPAREQAGAPKERSMRERPGRDRQVFQANRRQAVDPRFVGGPMDDFQREKYLENYSFINELKEHENKLLKRELRKKEYKRAENQESRELFQQTIGKNKGEVKVQRKQLQRLRVKAAVKNELLQSEGGLNRKLLKQRIQERLKETGKKRKFKR